jgi:arylsulfatase A-like enzyme
MAERANILLIVFDTARADAFSPYAQGCDTPSVEQLAALGTAYPKAIAPSCWTVPSHAAMFLGEPPRSVGMCSVPRGEARFFAQVLEQQRDKLLPEAMRRAGYRTSAVSTNLWVSPMAGFDHGFDVFHEAPTTRVRKMAASGVRARLGWYLDALRAKADDGAQVVEEMLDDWLRASPRAPFFWFVNLIECHSPYIPPKPFNDLGPLGRVAAAEDARRYQTLEAVLRAIATEVPPPERSRRRMRHLYDRSVALMDHWLGRILEKLDHYRALDSTLVIVTSDHGENFGEGGGLIGHGGSLDDRLVWVPFVAAGPGVAAAPEGVTSLADLPRFIADAVELSDHPWGESTSPGIAISQYDGPIDMNDPRAAALTDWGATADGRRRLGQNFTSATDGTLKLVRSVDGERLYDVLTDPLEVTSADAGAFPAERIASLRRAIDRADEQTWQPTLVDTPPPPPEEVADLEERMRLLGYL